MKTNIFCYVIKFKFSYHDSYNTKVLISKMSNHKNKTADFELEYENEKLKHEIKSLKVLALSDQRIFRIH